MAADALGGRREGGSAASVRHALMGHGGWPAALFGLVAAAIVIDSLRLAAPIYPRGDLLYHWALVHAILRGEIPPGGPYAGLPAYYPPGFHLLIAGASVLTRLTPEIATNVVGIAWLPVLPLSTFLLARRLTGRPWVAVLAAALTTFGGGFDFGADRLWVNSLFMAGHEAWPLFPRDLVFGLLPLAALAFVRALEPGARWLGWAALAGLLVGACALVQVQLLLPIPLAFATVAAISAARRRDRRAIPLLALIVCGLLGIVIVAPWFLGQLEAIRRNGGVALDSAETLLPAGIGFWSFPRQFGLVLPLALIGAGVCLYFLRQPDGPRTDDPARRPWRPQAPEAPLVLVAWFALPFVLAILYDPSWPLEDALRPQRLWLLSGQPATILAAIGLTATVERAVGGWRAAAAQRRRRGLVAAVLAVALLAVAVPTTLATMRLLSITWTVGEYTHLDFERDRVPAFGTLLGTSGAPRTVLTYEDWSSLVWYETGLDVVAVKPPGYAKLAYDPGVFTGRGQDERRTDLASAMRGDPTVLGTVADEYDAAQIVLARDGDLWRTVERVASLDAAVPGAAHGQIERVDGNGWDAAGLRAGARLTFDIAASGSLDLEVRLVGAFQGHPSPARAFDLVVEAGATRSVTHLQAPASGPQEWQVIRAHIELPAGARLSLEAVDPVVVQSLGGWVRGAAPPAGWHVARATDEAIILERQGS